MIFTIIGCLFFGFRFDIVYHYESHTLLQTGYSVIYSFVILISGLWSLWLLGYYNSKLIDESYVKTFVMTLIAIFGAFYMRYTF